MSGFSVFIVLQSILMINAQLQHYSESYGDIAYFEMADRSLIDVAMYNMQNIQSYKDYHQDLPPPIVLLHGFMNSRRYWDSLLTIMLNNTLFSNNPIITISLRGMGDSQYINLDTNNSYQTNIEDIFEILSSIGIDDDIKCIFIGQSFGSMITNKLVATKPNRVHGIVLMGSLFYADATIDHIIDTFKWYDGNNWTFSLLNHANTNWDIPYKDGRIDKKYWQLMKSEQMKFRFEIMTQTEFRPYDLRDDIEYFKQIPIIIVRGNNDFVPRATLEPLMGIGDNVKMLDYECSSCDHDIVYGHEQEICDKLIEMIQRDKTNKIEL